MESTARIKGSKKLNNIPQSQTLAMAAKVRELKSKGLDIISLTLGEPDFDTPQHIRDAAIVAVNESFTHYPPVPGIPELREAVAQFINTQYGLSYKAENVMVSTGAKQSLVNAFMSLLDPGNEIIIPAPFWVSYLPMAMLADGKPVIIKTSTKDKLKITPAQLEDAITTETRIFMFNNPSNPSGVVYTKEEMEGLVNVLERHPQVYIISDEIYSLITYDTPFVSFGSFRSLADRTIIINGVSKAFAMTGWRIGITIGPEWLIKLCTKFQGQVTSGASSISQRAALAAFNSDMAPSYAMRDEFRKRRDLCLKLFAEFLPEMILTIPEGAFYLYPDVSAYFGRCTPEGRIMQSTDDIVDYLVDDALVAMVAGTGFGTDAHIRMSYAASPEVLREAISRIKKSMEKLS